MIWKYWSVGIESEKSTLVEHQTIKIMFLWMLIIKQPPNVNYTENNLCQNLYIKSEIIIDRFN